MDFSKKKQSNILIVDDNPKNLQVLGSVLKKSGFQIGFAVDGKQALEIMSNSLEYDLVLLDIDMPVMNGYETCIAMREDKSLKEIPVIFLTAFINSENILKGFEVGAQDYVSKPFNTEELLARVSTQLELKHSKDQLKHMNSWLEKKVEERTEELKIANNKLLQLDTAKSEFLNIISHEIRTPLNGIVGVSSILNKYQLPQKVSELLNLLDNSAKRLEEFSIKALDISYFNTKKRDALSLDESDLNRIVIFQANKNEENAQKKNITISLKIETDDTLIKLYESYMNKCFSYIIDNAIKFGNEDSEVNIKIEALNENFIVSIENEGIPFPENFDISKIQPFNTKTHVDKNPALSLFLCKQIVEAHNGQIEIMKMQNGSIVRVIIPKSI